jgi:hypothetical protein
MLMHRTGATALRVLIVCAYNVTGKGVLAAVLLHTMDNVSWQLFPGAGSTYDPAYVAPITVAVAILAHAWTMRVVSRRPAVDPGPLLQGSQER